MRDYPPVYRLTTVMVCCIWFFPMCVWFIIFLLGYVYFIRLGNDLAVNLAFFNLGITVFTSNAEHCCAKLHFNNFSQRSLF